MHLQLMPGQTSVHGSVIIVNDNVTELSQETFELILHTDQDRVAISTEFDRTVVTIVDDDSKLYYKPTHIHESMMLDVAIQV